MTEKKENIIQNNLNSSKQSIKVVNYGCAANSGEGEMIAGLLQKDGFEVAGQDQETDLTVLNLCTVKGNSSAIKAVKHALEENQNTKLILTGCMTKSLAHDVKRFRPDVSVTTTHSLKQVPEIAKKLANNETITDFSHSKDIKINLPRIRNNEVTGIVPICSGCLDTCTFCSTRLVKGKLYSFPPEEIINDIKNLVASGCQEIWLTGQDSACYGFDLGTNLAHLVQQILDQVPGNYFIRIGMGNPRHSIEYIDELIKVFEDPRVYKFIHLPVQCGSDRVLGLMKRKHSVADYEFLVEKLKGRYNELSLSTDIIVGFPGETDDDFEQTLDLLRKTRPSGCNRTRFVPREGTAAAKLPGMTKAEKKVRSAKLTEVFKEIAHQNNQEWIGWEGEVLVNEVGSKGSWLAKNYAYRQIVLKGDYKLGQRVKVKLIEADTFHCIGQEIT